MTIDGDLLRRLLKVRDLLADDVEQAPELAALARLAHLSPHHLLRAFRSAFGETPHTFLTRQRIERAKSALRVGRTVTEVCFEVGFSSVGSFSALFRRHVGVPPIAYQRSIRLLAPAPGLVAPLTIPFCFLAAFAPSISQIAILEKQLPFRP